MNDTGDTTEDQDKEHTTTPAENLGSFRRLWQFLRRNARKIFWGYAVLVVLVFSFQAVCILIILRPSHEWAQFWASFGRSFATSPAAAGICAVIAATIAATQLSEQLKHSKEKAADEAWWKQFEWVTDRVISPGTDKAQLPTSLALNLMTSLSGSTAASFQKDAVGGILKHYLPDRHIDAAAFKSLGELVVTLPPAASAPARSVMKAYEYEREVVRALDHRFGDDFRTDSEEIFGADAVVQIENQSIAIDVKLSIPDIATLEETADLLKAHMALEHATKGVIVTKPPRGERASTLARHIDELPENILLVEWDPDMLSGELSSRIREKVKAAHDNDD